MYIGKLNLTEDKQYRSAVVTITPSDAVEILKLCNVHNRKISESTVKKYLVEIDSGEWYVTASGIGIDTNGVLTDGQHRLAAIARSGRPVKCLVLTGLAPASQEKIDRQMKRTLFDAFTLSGMSVSRKEVQVATFLARLTKSNSASLRSFPADVEVKEALETHIDSIRAVKSIIRKNDKGIAQAGVLASLVLGYEINPVKTVEFAKRLYGDIGFVRQDDPALRLKKCLTVGPTSNASGAPGAERQAWSFRKTNFALRAFFDGRFITSVREAESLCELIDEAAV